MPVMLESSIEDTPLLVNLLRLIRNGRSSNYRDHEHGPVAFHFGGLLMRDTGPYEDAARVWASAAEANLRETVWPSCTDAESRRGRGQGGSFYTGPLYLTVCIDGAVVERWTVEDYRERHTENSLPRGAEQVESLTSLVHILYAYLRMQEVYGEVMQRCTQQGDPGAAHMVGGEGEESPPADAAHPTSPRTGNVIGLTLCVSSSSSVTGPGGGVTMANETYHRTEMWAVGDLLRVTVHSNALWRSHMLRARHAAAVPLTTPRPIEEERDKIGATRSEASMPILCEPRRRPTKSPSPEKSASCSARLALVRSLATPRLTSSFALSASHKAAAATTASASPMLLARWSPTLPPPDFALPPSSSCEPNAAATNSGDCPSSVGQGGALLTSALRSPLTVPVHILQTMLLQDGNMASSATVSATRLPIATPRVQTPQHVRQMRHVILDALHVMADMHTYNSTGDDGMSDVDDVNETAADGGGCAGGPFELGSMVAGPLDSFDIHKPSTKYSEAVELLAFCQDANLRDDSSTAVFGELVQALVLQDIL